MLKLIASAIQGTVEDSTTTEEEILEALKKILQLLQQVDDKLDSSDPHNARSEGNGGIGGNSGYGGSFGNGGGSRADSLQSKQYQPVDQFNGRSDGGSEAAGSPASSATGSGAMASGSQEFGHDQKKQHLMVRVMRRNRTLIRFSMRFHFQQDQPRLDWMWMETPKTTTL
ncbi:MAG: hypothetical protein ACLS6O_02865 [Bifidobacterium sp.]